MQVTAKGIAGFLLAAASSPAQPYIARQIEDHGIAIVRLNDTAHGVEVSIVPSIGNLAFEMKVHGHNILHFPYADIAEFARQPAQCAIPLLAPWANRMTEQGFWANGKKYAFNLGLGNLRGALQIHGLLGNSPLWRVTEVSGRRSFRPRDQPLGVLEGARSHGAMAVRARIRDDLQPGRRRS